MRDSVGKINKAILLELLNELDAVCVDRVDLVVVGGAAMVLHGCKEWTKDIDSITQLPDTLFFKTPTMGYRHGLPATWLNDSLWGFETVAEEHLVPMWSGKHLIVFCPSVPYMFKMKASIANTDRHLSDVSALAKVAGFSLKEAEAFFRESTGTPLPGLVYYHLVYTLEPGQ